MREEVVLHTSIGSLGDFVSGEYGEDLIGGSEHLPPIEPTHPKGVMNWNPHGEYWEFCTPFECVNSAESNPDNRRNFLTKNYTAIFPDYKPGDVVTTSSSISACDMFIHMKLRTTQQELPNGVYVVDVGSSGLLLRPYYGSIDNYVAIPHSVEQLPSDMEVFFSKRKDYEDLGLRHKRGVLVYGSPGNGKTLRIMKCATEFVTQYECLVFTLSSSVRTVDFLHCLVPIIRNRNNIVIMEEITDRAMNDLQSTLRFLDGDTSWSNTYIIATTNYPDKLPASFIDRPGRFDVLIEVNDPDDLSRKTYIEHFLGAVDDSLVKEIAGYSIAYLREMIIRSKLDKVTLDVTIKMMKDRKVKIKNKFVVNGDSFGNYR
jgi:hypothetical protein